MIAILYRYPHPNDPTKFIYVGQQANPKKPRDFRHRAGKTSFGLRFKKWFPNSSLPQPIKEEVEVKDWRELNELETIWMFRYHTWRGYKGGMNLRLPEDKDYKQLAAMGGRVGGRRRIELHGNPGTPEGARKGGLMMGRIAGSKGGKISGRRNAESGKLLMYNHNRHHVNNPRPRCVLCSEQSLVIAYA